MEAYICARHKKNIYLSRNVSQIAVRKMKIAILKEFGLTNAFVLQDSCLPISIKRSEGILKIV